MIQLRFPSPWGPPIVDLVAKIRHEIKEGVKVSYHFCGQKIGSR